MFLAHFPLLLAAGPAPPLSEDLPLWGVVAFLGFAFALKKLGWDSLTSGMAAREASENKLISDAEQLRTETAAKLKENRGKMESLDERIREALAEAGRDAVQTKTDILALAARESKVSQARAEVEILRVKDQSLNEIFETLTNRVSELAEERIRARLGGNDQDQLISSTVQQFASQHS